MGQIQSKSPLGKARHDVIHGLADSKAIDLVVDNWKFPHKNTDKSPEAWAKLKESIPKKLAKRRPNGYKGDMGQRRRTENFKEIEKVTNTIVEALEAGAPLTTAASFAGIKMKDLEYWLQVGVDKPSSVYAVFRQILMRAVAQCDVQDLQALGSSPDWRAREARLKLRRFGQEMDPDAAKKGSVTVNIQNFVVEGSLPAPKVKMLSREELEDAFEQIPEQTGLPQQLAGPDGGGETDETGSGDSVLGSEASKEQTQTNEGEINGNAA